MKDDRKSFYLSSIIFLRQIPLLAAPLFSPPESPLPFPKATSDRTAQPM
jgi:hypothetical protein